MKGQTQDINSFHLCKVLHEGGVRVKQISVIGDDLSVISTEVNVGRTIFKMHKTRKSMQIFLIL